MPRSAARAADAARPCARFRPARARRRPARRSWFPRSSNSAQSRAARRRRRAVEPGRERVERSEADDESATAGSASTTPNRSPRIHAGCGRSAAAGGLPADGMYAFATLEQGRQQEPAGRAGRTKNDKCGQCRLPRQPIRRGRARAQPAASASTSRPGNPRMRLSNPAGNCRGARGPSAGAAANRQAACGFCLMRQ